MNPLNTIKGTIAAGVVLAIVIGLVSMGVMPNQLSLIIWLHVLAGNTWIGLLYYFNVALGTLENSPPTAFVIGVGAWLGTIMLVNVWVLIWPNQKKVLGLVEATADQIAKARRVAFIASRLNTVLSIPMLMSMVGFGHGGFFI